MQPHPRQLARSLTVLVLVTALPLACSAPQPSAAPPHPRAARPLPQDGRQQAQPDRTTAQEDPTDEALFDDLLENHWETIFPNGERNVGGPQFFKYIYENLATSHDLFKRYNTFYCGVSGAVVRPDGQVYYELVKVKGNDGRCVVGKYYRCCRPCACDLMKHARVEQATLKLPQDASGKQETYWVLTIGDPCHRCASSPCDDLPPEVQGYVCKDNVTANGLRVRDGKLTQGPGRLVFALLHDAAPADQVEQTVSAELLARCTPRISATPEQLKALGGMGNIFVDVARVNSDEELTNTLDDLCD